MGSEKISGSQLLLRNLRSCQHGLDFVGPKEGVQIGKKEQEPHRPGVKEHPFKNN